MPREIGSIPAADLDNENVLWFFFLRIEFPSPTGVLRWTDYPTTPDDAITLSIDGAPEAWDGSKVFEMGELAEGRASILETSTFSVGNADNVFSDLVNLHGVRHLPISVWLGWFDASTCVFVDETLLFEGEGDTVHVGPMVEVSVLPNRVPFTMKVPRRRFALPFGFKFLPPPNLKITFGDILVTLPEAPAGGGSTGETPFVPLPNLGAETPRMPLVRGGPTRPGTRELGPRGGVSDNTLTPRAPIAPRT